MDVCRTSTHGVALVRISDAGLKRAAGGSLQIQDAKIVKNLPSGHFVGLYLRNYGMYRQSEKNLLSSNNISSRRSHNMVNFGLLAAEIDPVVWGTPANFNGSHVVAALRHGSQVVGVSHTLRR